MEYGKLTLYKAVMRIDEDDPLMAEVADMAALVLREELAGGAMPLDRVACVCRAAIAAYLLFSTRRLDACAGPNPPGPNPN